MPRVTPDSLKKQALECGSIALHTEHEWQRFDNINDGIWCVDCEVWVCLPKEPNGHST